MSESYCASCGAELDAGTKFCPECGAEANGGGATPGTEESAAAAESQTGSGGAAASDTMFKVTAGLFVGYIAFVVLGVAASSNALVGLGAICVLVSLVTMYVDLRDLDGRLWDTRPILWVIGALLLYIVVAPLYIYKRRQVA